MRRRSWKPTPSATPDAATASASAKPSSTLVSPDSSTAVRFEPTILRWCWMSVTCADVPSADRTRAATAPGLVPSVWTRNVPTASLPVALAT